jgi:threonine synthase
MVTASPKPYVVLFVVSVVTNWEAVHGPTAAVVDGAEGSALVDVGRAGGTAVVDATCGVGGAVEVEACASDDGVGLVVVVPAGTTARRTV